MGDNSGENMSSEHKDMEAEDSTDDTRMNSGDDDKAGKISQENDKIRSNTDQNAHQVGENEKVLALR